MTLRIVTALAGIAAAVWAAPLAAQGYPSKPVRIIVPTSPGGASDAVTRLLAPRLSAALGQAFVVENRPPTMVGTALVAKSAPDGYTLLSGFDNFPLTQLLYRNVPYDARRDFEPISLLVTGPQALVVNPQMGVKDMGRFIREMKAKGDRANYSTAGGGTSSHLSVELFKQIARISPAAVHMKGGAPAITELLSGRVDMMIISLGGGNLASLVKSGRLLALGMSTPKRIPLFPDVPSIGEVFPGYEAEAWLGWVAPASTPKEVIARLNSEVIKALQAPEVRRNLEDQAYEIVGSSPQEFGKWIASEHEKWGRVIRDLRISLD